MVSKCDRHKMIVSVFRAFFKGLPAKVTEYRNYKRFDHNEFLRNLNQELIKCNSFNDEQQYDIFTSILRNVLDKHAPSKMKKLRKKQAKLMTRQLRKAIMDRSKFKNKYLKWRSCENFLAYKKAKNICNLLNKKAKMNYFKKLRQTEL